MSVIRSIAVFLCGIYLSRYSLAQKMSAGSCPEVTVQKDFQKDEYLGVWYEYARSYASFEKDGKCVWVEYTDNEDGTINVVNNMIGNQTNQQTSAKGIAKLASEDGEGKLSVKFAKAPFPGPYWVLETDYKSYSIVWSCTDFLIFNTRIAWILTRDKHPKEDVINKAYAVLDKNHIERSFLTVTVQDDCPKTIDS